MLNHHPETRTTSHDTLERLLATLSIFGAATPYIIAFIIRTIMLYNWDGTVIFDGSDYVENAQRISNGLGFVTSGGAPNAFRPPGMPFFLSAIYSLFGFHLALSAAILLLIEFSTIPLFAAIANRLGDTTASRTSAWLLGLQPFTAMYALSHHSEVFGILFLLSILYIFLRDDFGTYRFIVIGLLTGLLVWFRPVFQLLPMFLFVAHFRWKHAAQRRWRTLLITGACLLIGYTAVVVPWQLRNLHYFGKFDFVYQTGTNFYVGWHDGASGGYTFSDADDIGVPTLEQPALRDNVLFHRALSFIQTRPLESIKILVKKCIHLFVPQSRNWVYYDPSLETGSGWPPAHQAFLPFFLLTILSYMILLVGMLQWRTVNLAHPFIWLYTVISAYTLITMLSFFVDVRFRLPVELFFLLLIALRNSPSIYTTQPIAKWRSALVYTGITALTLSTLAQLVKWFMLA